MVRGAELMTTAHPVNTRKHAQSTCCYSPVCWKSASLHTFLSWQSAARISPLILISSRLYLDMASSMKSSTSLKGLGEATYRALIFFFFREAVLNN